MKRKTSKLKEICEAEHHTHSMAVHFEYYFRL